ncbi:hypothetical protein GKC49_10595 [Pantoea agglomerans]|uniref:Uncharacterized protein n=1 Tax=Enterobacter agglomerans TaxID=549 RepID=A0A7X2SVH8_ENTAG|nr:hypothetical protein [Pantoea agglomerans]
MSKFWMVGVFIAAILALGWAANHYYVKAVALKRVPLHSRGLSMPQAATIVQLHDEFVTSKRRLQLSVNCKEKIWHQYLQLG